MFSATVARANRPPGARQPMNEQTWHQGPISGCTARPYSGSGCGLARRSRSGVAGIVTGGREGFTAGGRHGGITTDGSTTTSPSADRPKLTRPAPGIDPDEFYRQVAAAYREYALQSRSPAKQIAAEDGPDVPVTTAHRWVREARRRGFLPPIRKGAVG